MSELPLILEPKTLAQSLDGYDNLLVVDLSGPEHYAQGHIPGRFMCIPGKPGGLVAGSRPAAGACGTGNATGTDRAHAGSTRDCL